MTFVKNVIFFYALLFSLSINAGELGNKLNDLFSSNDPTEILDPEVAFRVVTNIVSNNELLLSWDIELGYYLYKDKFSAKSNDTNVSLGAHVFPKGKLKEDPVFGEVEVYYGQDNVSIPIQITDTNKKEIEINVAYQGCKEDSVCYPPISKTLTVAVPDNFESSAINFDSKTSPVLISEQDSVTQKLKDKTFLSIVIWFFIIGVGLSLTPCVFPMIPILSGIIVGEGERITRARAVMLSISYVIAMAFTYSILGLLAGLFSLNLQAASQNIWVLSFFSLVFVLLALSMFGFYELQLPSSWQNKLSAGQDRAGKGTLKGAAIMGALSAIIVGPCVAPPLAGALLYISQTGDALLGGFALFAMGLGFGVPLLIVGATSGELLPRAGMWMENIKRVFGVIMLGVAIWFLERVLPEAVVLILWATLFITVAIFIGALDRIEAITTNWQRLCKGFGLVILIYGIILIIAAAYGGGTVLKPYINQSNSATTTTELPFKMISNLSDLDKELQQAKLEGKAVMLDFYADWCVVCHEMEAYTFSDTNVQTTLENVTLLKIDVTENNDDDKSFLKQFDLFGPPAILFFKNDSVEIKSHRLVGFVKAEKFVEHVKQVLTFNNAI